MATESELQQTWNIKILKLDILNIERKNNKIGKLYKIKYGGK